MTNVPELVEGPAVTEHVAVAPVPARVQLSTVVKVTCPVGVIAVPAVDESVTVAVQDVAWLTTTVVGEHDIVVVVGCAAGCEMLTVALPVLVAWVVSPG